MRIDSATTVTLPSTVTRSAGGLWDAAVDYEFEVNASGGTVLDSLLTGRPVGPAAAALAQQYGAPAATVLDDVVQLLESLNERSLIILNTPRQPMAVGRRILRHPLRQLSLSLGRFLALEPSRPDVTRRAGSVRSILRASRPLGLIALLAGVGLSTALTATLVASRGSELDASITLFALLPLWVSLLLWLGVVAHELGHFLWVPKERTVVLSRGVMISIAHPVLHGRLAVRVALAGPVIACVGCAGLGVLAVAAGAPSLFGLAAVALGLGHLAALMPWAHDGRMIWRSGR